MSFSHESDPIEYLLERRFPNHKLLVHPLVRGTDGSFIPADERKRLEQQVKQYRAELQAKSRDELATLVQQERAKEWEGRRQRAEKEERERFFNWSNARADFAHWSKAAHWTLDEAIALAFGKAPEVVTWKSLESLVNVSDFAKQFARTRDLALRAKTWQQLYDPVLPSIFLAWARRMDIAVPEELVQAVEARGIVIADWKDLFEKQKEEYLKLVKDRDHVFENLQNVAAQRNELQARVADLEQKAGAWQFDEAAENYPAELDIAMQAWRAISNQRESSATVKQQISAWLTRTYPKLSEEARERIATICNWEKRGGRRTQGT